MNNSSLEYDKYGLLVELNNEKASLLSPVIVYMSVLMVLGIFGNAMVCYYYGYATRRTSNSIFIVALAVFDLITCGITIPIEIADIRLFYMFTNVGACKILRFVNHFAGAASAATLLAIAADRFRHIHYPFKQQLNLRQTKLVCVITVVISILPTWPAFVLYDTVSVDIKNNKGINIQGTDCTTIRKESFKKYLWVHNGLYLFLFLSASVILSVLYSLIGRAILNQAKWRRNREQPTPTISNAIDTRANSSNNLSEIVENSSHVTEEITVDSLTCNEETQRECINSHMRNTNTKQTTSQSDDITRHPKQRPDNVDTTTVKYTVLMLTVTVVFIISYLPFLILVTWRTLVAEYEVDLLSEAGLIAVQIGLRSHLINSASNPLIYGFFNSKFRLFFQKRICCCFQRRVRS